MPKSTLAGHPLHPQLISAPLALLPFSLVMDVMHLTTGDETYAEVAHHAMKGGVAGALAAGAAGAMDYLEIPEGSHTKRIANLHGGMNLGLVGLYGVNLALRRGRRPPSGRLPTFLSLIGTGALAISAWYGGHMVYEHGMRVKGKSEIEGRPDAKPPYDDEVDRAFTRVEGHVPAGGPEVDPDRPG